MVKLKTQTYKTNSPAWVVAFWSASFAMGSWIAPVGVLIVPAIAKPTNAAPPIVSGPGAWAWQSSTAVATARTSLWSEIAGNSPIPAHILSLEETGGEVMLRAELVDEAAGSMGPTAWSVPIARCSTSTVHAASASDFVSSADGVNGVLTVRVDMGAVLIELPTIGTGVSLLGVQIELTQQVSFVDGSESVTRVALVLPIEFGQSFDDEVGPFAALAALIEGTTTERNNPTIYPWPEVPAPYYLDCTGVTAPGGGLGCLCDCWRVWNEHRADTDYNLGAWIYGCGLTVAGTLVICGALCIATVPTGGVAAPACILCLKIGGGASLTCILGLIADYTGNIVNDRNHRIECIENCQGLPASWEDIQPIKGIDE